MRARRRSYLGGYGSAPGPRPKSAGNDSGGTYGLATSSDDPLKVTAVFPLDSPHFRHAARGLSVGRRHAEARVESVRSDQPAEVAAACDDRAPSCQRRSALAGGGRDGPSFADRRARRHGPPQRRSVWSAVERLRDEFAVEIAPGRIARRESSIEPRLPDAFST